MDSKVKETTSLGLVNEIGVFGNLNMKDPTVMELGELARTTQDPHLKAYLEENLKHTRGDNNEQ